MDIQTILDKLHITELNGMQTDVAKAMQTTSDDIVILSPTGSGKTLAYLLPTIYQMRSDLDVLQVAVIVPSRELARQSLDVLESTGSKIRGMAIYGGHPAMDEHREMLKIHPQIIFATPGRLNDHIDKENFNTRSIRLLVIDEFDKCLEMGFADEMSKALKHMPSIRRRILLSATYSEGIPNFVNIGTTETINYLDDDTKTDTSERISEYMVLSEQKDKLDSLRRLLQSINGSSIVFLNYRDSVTRTADFLNSNGFVVSAYHGGMDQKSREDALYKFSNGSASVLVCTDLASRGLDIPDVDNIIHYHLPVGKSEYTHRIGRTARWDATGRTFILLGPEEHLPEFVNQDMHEYAIPANLQAPQQPKMSTLYIGKGKKDKISKSDVLGFLCKKCKLTGNEIGRIDVKERYCYVAVSRQKINTILRLAAGEKIKGIKTTFELVR